MASVSDIKVTIDASLIEDAIDKLAVAMLKASEQALIMGTAFESLRTRQPAGLVPARPARKKKVRRPEPLPIRGIRLTD